MPGNQAAYLPAALAKGMYVTVPEPLMVDKGLECVQEAMDVNMKGVSASEVVDTLCLAFFTHLIDINRQEVIHNGYHIDHRILVLYHLLCLL